MQHEYVGLPAALAQGTDARVFPLQLISLSVTALARLARISCAAEPAYLSNGTINPVIAGMRANSLRVLLCFFLLGVRPSRSARSLEGERIIPWQCLANT